MKTYFFGWKNFKWFIAELIKMYSNQDSYFSKKRIESGIAFIIAQWGLVHWLILNIEKLTVGEITLWAAVDLSISGYILNKIQKEKNEDVTGTPSNNS